MNRTVIGTGPAKLLCPDPMKTFPIVLSLCALFVARAASKTYEPSTATVLEIQAAMDAGVLTSEKLTQLYLARIAAYDQVGPQLNTVITLNPKAPEIARALDAERKAKGPRSALHGVPIFLKDNFDTADLPTHHLRPIQRIAEAAPNRGETPSPVGGSENARPGGSARLSTVTGFPT